VTGISWQSPQAFWLLAVLPLYALAPFRSHAGLSSMRLATLSVLRALCCAAVVFALARPVQRTTGAPTRAVALVDVSASMLDASLEAARAFVADLQGDPASALAVLTFGARARSVPSLARTAFARHDDAGTNLERAIDLALGTAEDVRDLLLFSDGRETAGSVERAVEGLRARGVRLWVKSPDATPREVGIAHVELPESVRVGEPFALRARIASTDATAASISLVRVGSRSTLEETRSVDLQQGDTTIAFETRAGSAGRVSYRVELHPLGTDHFPENNHYDVQTRALGAPRVLLLERELDQVYALRDMLEAANLDVDTRGPDGAPRTFEDFDFVILSDVPAEMLTPEARRALLTYVSAGGGLLVAGGERTFGLGGYAGTPLETLSAVALDTEARRDRASIAMLLAIDKSGSMAGAKLEHAKEAAIATAELLPRDALLGVLGFDAMPETIVSLAPVSSLPTFARKVATLSAGGGTALFPALDAAYAALTGVRARVKHVVVLTDGQTQEESLTEIARSMRADGITISTIGLGEQVNRGLLSELARLGQGRAYQTRDAAKVPRLFSTETAVVSRSLTVERAVRAKRLGDADFLRGVEFERAPPLRGYVSTRARRAPAELLLATSSDEPLLARMRVGRGWALAWTSDLKPRWAADWFRFRGFSRLVAQLVREHMRTDMPDALTLDAQVDGDQLRATIDVLDAHGRFVNGLTGQLEIAAEGALVQTVELLQRAPGRYQADTHLTGLGTFGLRARLTAPPGRDGEVAPAHTASAQVAHPFPAEYRPPFAPRRAWLDALAARTGGGSLPSPRNWLAARGHLGTQRAERWPWLVGLALASFLLEITLRRLGPRGIRSRQGT